MQFLCFAGESLTVGSRRYKVTCTVLRNILNQPPIPKYCWSPNWERG